MKPSILITGFGPFPGVATNASGLLVPKLARAARKRFADCEFHTAILPTQWQRGTARARAAFVRSDADISIHFGVSSRADGFVIERRGVNACLQTSDSAGALPQGLLLDPVGPARRPATLPVQAIVSRLKARGLPVVSSDDAGGYLCNAVLYQSLGLAAARPRAIAGFVHLPAYLADPDQAAIVPQSLTFAQALSGSLEIIAVCLER